MPRPDRRQDSSTEIPSILAQADVEDDGVVGLAFAQKVALLAVEGAVDT